jgi:hypothetical protein
MAVTMNRYDRAMDAMDSWLEIARAIPGFNVALDVGDIERAIELAMLHGANTDLAAYLVAKAFAVDSLTVTSPN